MNAARARGRKGGRPKVLEPAKRQLAVKLYAEKQHTIIEICRMMGISKPSGARSLPACGDTFASVRHGRRQRIVAIGAEVMGYYRLTRSPRSLGYHETAHHRQLLQDIKQAAYDADLVALCGVVGAGKTVTLRRLQEVLARENRVIVSKAVAIEKAVSR